jgi:glycosyltransferase involved in cell wall biosynthesis
MPVFNAEKYLRASISSVLDQSFEDFELIIINDGSVDTSEAVIQSFHDKRIRYYRQSNQGQVIASNTGIGLAKGRFIKFLDADDLLNSRHLELQLNVLDGDQSKLASCEWAYFHKNPEQALFGKEYTHKDYTNPMDWFFDSHHFDKGMLGAWMWLIPRKLLEKAGYWNEKLTLNNDFDLSTRLICASEGIRFAKGAKLYYRKGHLNALTHSKSTSAYESALLTTELAMKNVLNREDSERMRRLFADRFQWWIYEIYPQHRNIVYQMGQHVENLGGSILKPIGGRVFKMLNSIFPWKWVSMTQYYLHQSIWKPILKWKNKQKLKNNFSSDF